MGDNFVEPLQDLTVFLLGTLKPSCAMILYNLSFFMSIQKTVTEDQIVWLELEDLILIKFEDFHTKRSMVEIMLFSQCPYCSTECEYRCYHLRS